MNLKKALQAFLVTVSCGVLNIAGAQQRPVFIPEDYVAEQAQADFVANGPKLLFSDSPETVYNNGILYRDKVEGDVRLFLHHVNGVAGKKKLAVMLKNTDNLRPVTYNVTRSGVAGFNYDYMRDGKNSQKEYFDDSSQKPQDGKLGFGRSHELLSGRGIILPTDKLYTATIDLHFDKPVEVSVLMCETKSDLELFNEAAAIQPMDEHPLRGTFEAADWNYTLKKPVNAPEKPLMLELATSQEGYAKGVRGIVTVRSATSVTFLAPGHYPASTVRVLLLRRGRMMPLGKIRVANGTPKAEALYGISKSDTDETLIERIDLSTGGVTRVATLGIGRGIARAGGLSLLPI